jgi:hypothetical protein
MFKAIGLKDEDLERPLVGVANTWIEIGPCNYHLRRLAAKVKEGIRAAGGTPLEFNTVSISDGITMGSEGMKASLVSREVIADSIELVSRGNMFDAVVALSGCDKTIPGTVMALVRVNVPGLMLYGGSIMYGEHGGRRLTGPLMPGGSRPRSSAPSKTPLVPAPAPAAGSSPPTPWRPPSRCWGSRRWGWATSPPWIPGKTRSLSSAAGW